MLISLLAAVAINSSAVNINSLGIAPTINLDAVRQLDCVTDDGYMYMGSGYMVAKNIIYSVNHVADADRCKDHRSGVKLHAYVRDLSHDFAIFTGPVPLNGPYIKYSCEPYHRDEAYTAYGYSSYGYPNDALPWYDTTFLRGYSLVGTGKFTDDSFLVGKERTPWPGMSILDGRAAPGISGGPIVDRNGYVHGGINVGVQAFGIPAGPSYSYSLHDTVACQSSK